MSLSSKKKPSSCNSLNSLINIEIKVNTNNKKKLFSKSNYIYTYFPSKISASESKFSFPFIYSLLYLNSFALSLFAY